MVGRFENGGLKWWGGLPGWWERMVGVEQPGTGRVSKWWGNGGVFPGQA